LLLTLRDTSILTYRKTCKTIPNITIKKQWDIGKYTTEHLCPVRAFLKQENLPEEGYFNG